MILALWLSLLICVLSSSIQTGSHVSCTASWSLAICNDSSRYWPDYSLVLATLSPCTLPRTFELGFWLRLDQSEVVVSGDRRDSASRRCGMDIGSVFFHHNSTDRSTMWLTAAEMRPCHAANGWSHHVVSVVGSPFPQQPLSQSFSMLPFPCSAAPATSSISPFNIKGVKLRSLEGDKASWSVEPSFAPPFPSTAVGGSDASAGGFDVLRCSSSIDLKSGPTRRSRGVVCGGQFSSRGLIETSQRDVRGVLRGGVVVEAKSEDGDGEEGEGGTSSGVWLLLVVVVGVVCGASGVIVGTRTWRYFGIFSATVVPAVDAVDGEGEVFGAEGEGEGTSAHAPIVGGNARQAVHPKPTMSAAVVHGTSTKSVALHSARSSGRAFTHAKGSATLAKPRATTPSSEARPLPSSLRGPGGLHTAERAAHVVARRGFASSPKVAHSSSHPRRSTPSRTQASSRLLLSGGAPPLTPSEEGGGGTLGAALAFDVHKGISAILSSKPSKSSLSAQRPVSLEEAAAALSDGRRYDPLDPRFRFEPQPLPTPSHLADPLRRALTTLGVVVKEAAGIVAAAGEVSLPSHLRHDLAMLCTVVAGACRDFDTAARRETSIHAAIVSASQSAEHDAVAVASLRTRLAAAQAAADAAAAQLLSSVPSKVATGDPQRIAWSAVMAKSEVELGEALDKAATMVYTVVAGETAARDCIRQEVEMVVDWALEIEAAACAAADTLHRRLQRGRRRVDTAVRPVEGEQVPTLRDLTLLARAIGARVGGREDVDGHSQSLPQPQVRSATTSSNAPDAASGRVGAATATSGQETKRGFAMTQTQMGVVVVEGSDTRGSLGLASAPSPGDGGQDKSDTDAQHVKGGSGVVGLTVLLEEAEASSRRALVGDADAALFFLKASVEMLAAEEVGRGSVVLVEEHARASLAYVWKEVKALVEAAAERSVDYSKRLAAIADGESRERDEIETSWRDGTFALADITLHVSRTDRALRAAHASLIDATLAARVAADRSFAAVVEEVVAAEQADRLAITEAYSATVQLLSAQRALGLQVPVLGGAAVGAGGGFGGLASESATFAFGHAANPPAAGGVQGEYHDGDSRLLSPSGLSQGFPHAFSPSVASGVGHGGFAFGSEVGFSHTPSARPPASTPAYFDLHPPGGFGGPSSEFPRRRSVTLATPPRFSSPPPAAELPPSGGPMLGAPSYNPSYPPSHPPRPASSLLGLATSPRTLTTSPNNRSFVGASSVRHDADLASAVVSGTSVQAAHEAALVEASEKQKNAERMVVGANSDLEAARRALARATAASEAASSELSASAQRGVTAEQRTALSRDAADAALLKQHALANAFAAEERFSALVQARDRAVASVHVARRAAESARSGVDRLHSLQSGRVAWA